MTDCEQLEFLLRGREIEVQEWMRKASDYLSRAERAETEAGDLRKQLATEIATRKEAVSALSATEKELEAEHAEVLRLDALDTCTPAERAVLDAMAAIDGKTLKSWLARRFTTVERVAYCEIARRGSASE